MWHQQWCQNYGTGNGVGVMVSAMPQHYNTSNSTINGVSIMTQVTASLLCTRSGVSIMALTMVSRLRYWIMLLAITWVLETAMASARQHQQWHQRYSIGIMLAIHCCCYHTAMSLLL